MAQLPNDMINSEPTKMPNNYYESEKSHSLEHTHTCTMHTHAPCTLVHTGIVQNCQFGELCSSSWPCPQKACLCHFERVYRLVQAVIFIAKFYVHFAFSQAVNQRYNWHSK